MVVGILTVVIFLLASRINLPGVGNAGAILEQAPKGLVPVEVEGGPVSVEGGVNLSSGKATFRSVGGKKATAVAERVYGGGSYTLTVNATFVGSKGHKYQVWLTDGGDNLVDAGFMEGSGDLWTLTFRDDDNGHSKLRAIWITDEITTEDNKPESHILEGSF